MLQRSEGRRIVSLTLVNAIMACLQWPSSIRPFRNEKGTEAEMRPAIVSGIVTGDTTVSYWPVFPCP